jgi:GT2 family glycosyltransferase/2-polyprenyl-3-methyl-5-hydroxy-6-metoxy-1,4-benzoquinol methylase
MVDPKSRPSGSPCKYDFTIDLENKNLAHSIMVELVGRGKRVLDVGCATGYLDRVLVEHGCIVTGVEVNSEAAAQARRFCAEVINANIEQLDWERALGDKRFDVILFGDVLEHLIDPQRVLRNARDFLGPEGYVVASIPNVAHASLRLQLLQGVFQYRPLGLLDETHLRFFTSDSIKSMFDQAGFIIVDTRRVKLGPFDTEIELERNGFPPGVLEFVLQDEEATTYQFVCRAHGKNQPIVLSIKLKKAQESLSSATAELEQTKRLLARSEEELQSERAALGEARQQLARSELEQKYLRAERLRSETERIRHQYEVSCVYPFIDIVTVSHNSAGFLGRFMKSLGGLEYPPGKLTLTVVDNASTDGTNSVVDASKDQLGFPLRYLRLSRNRGYAGGGTIGAELGKAEYVCVVNPDTEFYPDTLKELVAAVSKDSQIGLADARQVPYEHPKYFHPLTEETSWCSGACFLIRRSVIDKVGLFDAKFFMYCEDVDLSWRVWSAGFKCVYATKALILHHKNPANYKPSVDYFYGVRNGFLMRLIYGGLKDMMQYYTGIWSEIRGAQSDPVFRRNLWRAALSHLPLIPHALWRRWRLPGERNQWIKFRGWDYGENR